MHVTRNLLLAPVIAAALATGCGGKTDGETPLPAGQSVAVSVTPPSAQLVAGGTVGFAATVTGTIDTRVTWSVVEVSGGTIDSTGHYVAPATAGGFHVRATSVADPTASGQAAITVLAPPPPVSVTIAPRTPSVTVGGTITFTATVANATDTRVTWSVLGTACGSITAAGVYTPPAAAATCSVRGTSVADPSKSDTATVTVTAPLPVVVTVSPSPGAVDACKTLQLTATVTNTTNRSVTWSIQEGAAGGSVSTSGVYTAPSTGGTYHTVATSVADPGKYAITAITVTERVLSVAVNPPTTTLQPGGTAQFTATVTTTCGAFVATGP
jgi:uncharacterized protein YjdB